MTMWKIYDQIDTEFTPSKYYPESVNLMFNAATRSAKILHFQCHYLKNFFHQNGEHLMAFLPICGILTM